MRASRGWYTCLNLPYYSCLPVLTCRTLAGSTREQSRSRSLISTSELSESAELSKQLTESVNLGTTTSDSSFQQVCHYGMHTGTFVCPICLACSSSIECNSSSYLFDMQ